MEIRTYAYTDRDQKIWFISPSTAKYKLTRDGETKIIQVDTSHIKDDIYYRSKNKNALDLILVAHGGNADLDIGRNDRVAWQLKQWIDATIPDDPASSDYPVFVYLAQGETETDEPATDTWVFPPPETHEEFMARVSARMLHLTRRIRVLRHEEPHQNALSTDICREVPAGHEEVLRYDIACNLLKRPVGWLALQLQTHQNRYNQYLGRKVAAELAGRTPPTFAYDGERVKIEAMLEKLETHLTEECLEEHFDLHDHGEWDKIQNKQRKITLCAEDLSPGEVIVDVNSFFTDGNGRVAEAHAKRTYHEISTKYWVMAKRTPHRNLVTERFVTLD